MYKTSIYFNCVIVVWLLVWDLHILTIRTLPPSGKNGSIIANKRQANYPADTPITLYLPRNHLAIARASVNTFWRAYSAWNIQNSYRRVPRMILSPTPRIPSCHHHKSLDIIKVPPLVSYPILARPRSGWVMWAHLGRRYEPKPPPRRHGGTNERCVSYEFPRWVFGDDSFFAISCLRKSQF